VHKIVSGNNGSADDVQEVLQESIVTLYKKALEPDFNLRSALRSYFYGIARNQWYGQLRHRQRFTGEMVELPDDYEEQMEEDRQQGLIHKTILRLSEECRKLLNMVSRGMSFKEISKNLKLSSEEYARRKKYLCKESLVKLLKEDPEFRDYYDF
jgi:RNA polymerase sigma factor (sigma-70 family)